MRAARRIGVMGGTFDPIHKGHLDLGRAAVTTLELDQLLVLPTSEPPHRPAPVASSHHRFAMAAIAVAGRPGWRVSDIELQVAGPSYTSATLDRLRASGCAPSELFFVVGADAFADVATWKNYPELLEQAHFAVVSRPAWPVRALQARLSDLAGRMVPVEQMSAREAGTMIILIDAVTADVSSTAIRAHRAAGRSIGGLVDPRVEQHVEQHGLYAPDTPVGASTSDSRTGPAGRLHG